MWKQLLLSMLVLVVSSSIAVAAETPDPDKVAGEFCACLNPKYRHMEATMEAFGDGDTGRLLELNQTFKPVKAKADACQNVLRQRYGGLGRPFAHRVNAGLKRQCPSPRMQSLPTMGGVGGASAGSGTESLNEFMRQQGAPARH